MKIHVVLNYSLKVFKKMVKNSIVGGLKEEGVGEGGDIIPAF